MMLISDLDISTLILNGFFAGIVMSIGVGLLAYGINFAYKMFDF